MESSLLKAARQRLEARGRDDTLLFTDRARGFPAA
jgi:hypothetical protein